MTLFYFLMAFNMNLQCPGQAGSARGSKYLIKTFPGTLRTWPRAEQGSEKDKSEEEG